MNKCFANTSTYGKFYYDTGELKYEGHYKVHEKGHFTYPCGEGVEYYKAVLFTEWECSSGVVY